MTPSAHDTIAAQALARGLATWQLCGIKLHDPDPVRRRIAAPALALRHPIYAPKKDRPKF